VAKSARKTTPSRGSSAKGRAQLAVSRPELLVDGSDGRFNRMMGELLTLRSLLNAMREKRAEAAGLGGIEYGALLTLSRLPGGEVGVQELADRLRLSGAFTTSTVNALVDKGLVAKASHPTDKRRVRLAVTARGGELLARFAPMRRQVNDVAFEPLTATQFHQFCEILSRLTESTERAMALQDYLLKAGGGLGRRREAGRRRAG
jgi:DNA-binding MarR family transcriptional regulator